MDQDFYTQSTIVEIPIVPKPVESWSLPQKIGPYKIESLLTRGGMSVLYLAVHPESKKTVVVKVLSPKYVTHPELVDQFLKEAEIIKRATHPNVVQLYGQGSWEKGLYLAMEFIRGISLRQFILQQSLSLKRSVDIILQVAYALHHLHLHGIIHGDLKPENILINEEGEVKVIDFGIAKCIEEVKREKKNKQAIAGTPNYMSPEQKQNSSHIGFASDIYSLGIIAYELAMGKLSFGAVHLSLLPKGLRKILEKALATSIAERYASVLSFINDLSNYLKTGGIEKDRPSSDQFKEIIESLHLTSIELSAPHPPHWPQVEVGLAKYQAPGELYSYFDFYTFPKGVYAFLLAEVKSPHISSCMHIAHFRGMITSCVAEKEYCSHPLTLLKRVQEWMFQGRFIYTMNVMLLLLDEINHELTYFCCGIGSLFHFSRERPKPEQLINTNSSFGVTRDAEYVPLSYNWQPGDGVVIHSFDPSCNPSISSSIETTALFSAQGQAESLLKMASSQPFFNGGKHPKLVVCLQRLG